MKALVLRAREEEKRRRRKRRAKREMCNRARATPSRVWRRKQAQTEKDESAQGSKITDCAAARLVARGECLAKAKEREKERKLWPVHEKNLQEEVEGAIAVYCGLFGPAMPGNSSPALMSLYATQADSELFIWHLLSTMARVLIS